MMARFQYSASDGPNLRACRSKPAMMRLRTPAEASPVSGLVWNALFLSHAVGSLNRLSGPKKRVISPVEGRDGTKGHASGVPALVLYAGRPDPNAASATLASSLPAGLREETYRHAVIAVDAARNNPVRERAETK